VRLRMKRPRVLRVPPQEAPIVALSSPSRTQILMRTTTAATERVAEQLPRRKKNVRALTT